MLVACSLGNTLPTFRQQVTLAPHNFHSNWCCQLPRPPPLQNVHLVRLCKMYTFDLGILKGKISQNDLTSLVVRSRKRNIRGPLATVSHNIGWTIEGWQAKRAEENKDQWHGKPQRKPSKKKDKSLDGRNAKYPWRTYQGRPQGRRTEKKAKWSKVDPSSGGCRGGRSLTEIKLTPSFWEIPHRWNRFQNTVFCVISEMYNQNNNQ